MRVTAAPNAVLHAWGVGGAGESSLPSGRFGLQPSATPLSPVCSQGLFSAALLAVQNRPWMKTWKGGWLRSESLLVSFGALTFTAEGTRR